MDNVEALNANFPDALALRRYLTRLRDAIEPLGFDRANTFTVVSVCRDELAQAIVPEISEFWRRPFDLGGLAGLPPGGEETWQAGLSHIPDNNGRGRLLVIAAAHIGIAPDGTLGRVQRHSQNSTTTACGALGAISAALVELSRTGTPELSATDTEAGRLKRSLIDAVPENERGDIAAVTRACAGAIDESIWQSLEALACHLSSEIVVASGVQIHLHDDADHFLPVATTFKGEDGKLVALELT